MNTIKFNKEFAKRLFAENMFVPSIEEMAISKNPKKLAKEALKKIKKFLTSSKIEL